MSSKDHNDRVGDALTILISYIVLLAIILSGHYDHGFLVGWFIGSVGIGILKLAALATT